MSSSDRYRISSPAGNRSGTYHAVDTETGREVYVHILDHASQGDLLNQIRQRLSASEPGDSGGVIEIIDRETTSSVVTEATPRCEHLEAWASEAQPEPGGFTELFEAPASSGPEPTPPGNQPPTEPGEFTGMFRSADVPQEQLPTLGAPPAAPKPPPPQTPGEFTRMFQQAGEKPPAAEPGPAPTSPEPPRSPDAGEFTMMLQQGGEKAPAVEPGPAHAPPAPPPSPDAGEFTMMFQQGGEKAPPAEPGPAPTPPEPPPSPDAGEFTMMFQQGGEKVPAAEPGPAPAPQEPPQSPEAGEFTMMFQQGGEKAPPAQPSPAPSGPSMDDFFSESPPSRPDESPTVTLKRAESAPPSPGQKSTGEVTHFLNRNDIDQLIHSEKQRQPPPQPPPKPPPAAKTDDFDNMFSPEQPASSSNADSEPGSFTRLFSQPGAAQKHPGPGAPDLWEPEKPADAGGLTQMLRGEPSRSGSPYSGTPAMDATRVFDARSRPPETPPAQPVVGEGEYTRMMSAPAAPAAAPSEPQQATPPGTGKDTPKRPINIFLVLALVFVTLLLVVLGAAWLINEFRSPETASDEPAATSTTPSGGAARAPTVRGPSVRQPNVRGPSVQGSSVRGPSVHAPSVRKPTVTGGRIPTRIPQSSTSQTGQTPASEGGGQKYLIIIAIMGTLLLVAIGIGIYMLVKR